MLSENDISLSKNDISLSENDILLSENDISLSQNDILLSENNISLNENDILQSVNDISPRNKTIAVMIYRSIYRLRLISVKKSPIYCNFHDLPIIACITFGQYCRHPEI